MLVYLGRYSHLVVIPNSQLISALRRTNIAKIRTLRGAELIAQENTSTSDVIPRSLRTPCPNGGEVCQRGPQAHQAETTRNGPHRKTFIRPGIRCAERE
jgi:hypothetical protein